MPGCKMLHRTELYPIGFDLSFWIYWMCLMVNRAKILNLPFDSVLLNVDFPTSVNQYLF